jgi:hypothetical protein
VESEKFTGRKKAVDAVERMKMDGERRASR